MNKVRLVAKLEIKGRNLIKGIQLEGLRVVGVPSESAAKYYKSGIDELIYMDTVASLYGRNGLHEFVKETAANIFIPFTVGGGVRSVSDVESLLLSGADKVAVNTAAVKNAELISDIANQFGSQACVVEIQAKRQSAGEWSVMVDNGREPSNLTVERWANIAAGKGAGEILLTSVDNDGTKKGPDVDLYDKIVKSVDVPVVASGGFGSKSDVINLIQQIPVSGIAIASLFHYGDVSITEMKNAMISAGIEVRR